MYLDECGLILFIDVQLRLWFFAIYEEASSERQTQVVARNDSIEISRMYAYLLVQVNELNIKSRWSKKYKRVNWPNGNIINLQEYRVRNGTVTQHYIKA